MLFPSYALEVAVVAGLLILVLLRWRYERRCVLIGPLCDTPSEMDELVASNPENRGNRAMALMCAAVVWRGDPTDTEGMLGVADEFLQYIEGNDASMPRPDKLSKGYIPR